MSSSNTRRRKLKKRAQAALGRSFLKVRGKLEVYHFDREVFDQVMEPKLTSRFEPAVGGTPDPNHAPSWITPDMLNRGEAVVLNKMAVAMHHGSTHFFSGADACDALPTRSDERRFAVTPIGRGKFQRTRPDYFRTGKSFLAENFMRQAAAAEAAMVIAQSETSANLRRGGFEQVSEGRWVHPDGREVLIDR